MYVVALFIEAVSAVQHQGEIAPLGDAYPVMLPGYRGKIDDKEQIFLFCLVSSDKAENTAVSVIGVDPLKSLQITV